MACLFAGARGLVKESVVPDASWLTEPPVISCVTEGTTPATVLRFAAKRVVL